MLSKRLQGELCSVPRHGISQGACWSLGWFSFLQDEILLTPWRDFPVEDTDPFPPPVSFAPSALTASSAQLKEGSGAVSGQLLPQFPHPHSPARSQFPGTFMMKVQTSERLEPRGRALSLPPP